MQGEGAAGDVPSGNANTLPLHGQNLRKVTDDHSQTVVGAVVLEGLPVDPWTAHKTSSSRHQGAAFMGLGASVELSGSIAGSSGGLLGSPGGCSDGRLAAC